MDNIEPDFSGFGTLVTPAQQPATPPTPRLRPVQTSEPDFSSFGTPVTPSAPPPKSVGALAGSSISTAKPVNPFGGGNSTAPGGPGLRAGQTTVPNDEVQPFGKAPAQAFSGLTAGVQSGVTYAGKSIIQTGQTVTGGTPTFEAPPPEASLPKDWSDPESVGKWIGFQLGQSAPGMGAAVGLGAVLSKVFGIGGSALTGAATAATAFGVVSFAQAMGPVYAQELAAGVPKEKAFDDAFSAASKQGALGAIGGAAFSIAPFKSALSNIFFQSTVVQQAVNVGGQIATNITSGKDALDGVPETALSTLFGTIVPAAGMHLLLHPPAANASPADVKTWTDTAKQAQSAAPNSAAAAQQQQIFRTALKAKGWSDDSINGLLAGLGQPTKEPAGQTTAAPAAATSAPETKASAATSGRQPRPAPVPVALEPAAPKEAASASVETPAAPPRSAPIEPASASTPAPSADKLAGLDQRIEAAAEERRNGPGINDIRTPEGRLAAVLQSASGVSIGDFNHTLDSIQWAMELGRPDLAETIVQRWERYAGRPPSLPGVPPDSPRYAEIQRDLINRSDANRQNAATLRRRLDELTAQSKEAPTVDQSAHAAATSPLNDLPQPTGPQKTVDGEPESLQQGTHGTLSSGTQYLAQDAGSVPRSGIAGLSDVRRARHQGVSALAGELPGISGGHGAAPFGEALAGPEGRQQRVQPGQLSLGDAGTAGAEPTRFRGESDLSGPLHDNRGVVAGVGRTGNDHLQPGEPRNVGGSGAVGGQAGDGRSPAAADHLRGANASRQGVGAGIGVAGGDAVSAAEQGLAPGQGSRTSLASNAAHAPHLPPEEARSQIRDTVKSAGLDQLDAAFLDRATQLLSSGRAADVVDAVGKAAVQLTYEEATPEQRAIYDDKVPGFAEEAQGSAEAEDGQGTEGGQDAAGAAPVEAGASGGRAQPDLSGNRAGQGGDGGQAAETGVVAQGEGAAPAQGEGGDTARQGAPAAGVGAEEGQGRSAEDAQAAPPGDAGARAAEGAGPDGGVRAGAAREGETAAGRVSEAPKAPTAGQLKQKMRAEARQRAIAAAGGVKPSDHEGVAAAGKSGPDDIAPMVASWHGEARQMAPEAVQEILADPKVRAALERPYTVKRDVIPYVAGYSNDGHTIYIDHNIPTDIEVERTDGSKGYMDPTPFLVLHERLEKALIDTLNYKYQGAHQPSVGAEHAALEAAGWKPESYENALKPYKDKAAKGDPKRVPADLDQTPYIDAGGTVPAHVDMPNGPHNDRSVNADGVRLPEKGAAGSGKPPAGTGREVRPDRANEGVGPEPAAAKPDVSAAAAPEDSVATRGRSKIGKSIEQKAIEARLTNGFEGTAGYDKITIKDQAERAAKLINGDIEEARAVIRGEQDLPAGLRGTALITAMEAYLKTHPDVDAAYELANSPLVTATSEAAQELRLAAERDPDSATAKLADIKAAMIKKAGGTKKVAARKAKMVKSIKAEMSKVNLSKEDRSWSRFLSSIEC